MAALPRSTPSAPFEYPAISVAVDLVTLFEAKVIALDEKGRVTQILTRPGSPRGRRSRDMDIAIVPDCLVALVTEARPVGDGKSFVRSENPARIPQENALDSICADCRLKLLDGACNCWPRFASRVAYKGPERAKDISRGTPADAKARIMHDLQASDAGPDDWDIIDVILRPHVIDSKNIQEAHLVTTGMCADCRHRYLVYVLFWRSAFHAGVLDDDDEDDE